MRKMDLEMLISKDHDGAFSFIVDFRSLRSFSLFRSIVFSFMNRQKQDGCFKKITVILEIKVTGHQ